MLYLVGENNVHDWAWDECRCAALHGGGATLVHDLLQKRDECSSIKLQVVWVAQVVGSALSEVH